MAFCVGRRSQLVAEDKQVNATHREKAIIDKHLIRGGKFYAKEGRDERVDQEKTAVGYREQCEETFCNNCLIACLSCNKDICSECTSPTGNYCLDCDEEDEDE